MAAGALAAGGARASSVTASPVLALEKPSSIRTDRLVYAFLVLVAVFRLAYLWCVPLGLVGDEAYYWDWSRQPAWGYYSKPPMVAWLISAATAVGGHHTETIRSLAVAFTSASLFVSYRLARELFDARTGAWFVAALALAPAALAQNLIFTIDAPLLFCWSAGMWCFVRWLGAGSQSSGRKWGVGLAVCLGGGLLTKQMMAVFPLLAALHLATSPEHRHRLRQPGFWIIVSLGCVTLIPLLVWNARHGWIMLHHTAHHFESAPSSWFEAPARVAEFIAGEVALSGVVIGIIGIVAAAAAVRRMHRRELNEAERLLFWFGVPAIVVMTGLALRQRVNLNWPLVYLPPLILLAVHWSLPGANGHRRLRIGHWLKAGVGVSATLTVIGCAYPVTVRSLALEGTKADLTARLRGWEPLAKEVDSALRLLRERSAEPVFVMTVGHRYVTSQLAFHLPGQPRVMRWPSAPGQIESQYEVWGGLEDRSGENALIVHQVGGLNSELSSEFRAAFAAVEPLRTVRIPLGGGRERRYELHLGRRFSPASNAH